MPNERLLVLHHEAEPVVAPPNYGRVRRIVDDGPQAGHKGRYAHGGVAVISRVVLQGRRNGCWSSAKIVLSATQWPGPSMCAPDSSALFAKLSRNHTLVALFLALSITMYTNIVC